MDENGVTWEKWRGCRVEQDPALPWFAGRTARSGEIDVSEFDKGCIKLRGSARLFDDFRHCLTMFSVLFTFSVSNKTN